MISMGGQAVEGLVRQSEDNTLLAASWTSIELTDLRCEASMTTILEGGFLLGPHLVLYTNNLARVPRPSFRAKEVFLALVLEKHNEKLLSSAQRDLAAWSVVRLLKRWDSDGECKGEGPVAQLTELAGSYHS